MSKFLDNQPTFLSLIDQLEANNIMEASEPVSNPTIPPTPPKELSDWVKELKNQIKNIRLSRQNITHQSIQTTMGRYHYAKQQAISNFWDVSNQVPLIFFKAMKARLSNIEYSFENDMYYQVSNQEEQKLASNLALFTLLNYYGEPMSELSSSSHYQELLKNTAAFAQTNTVMSLLFQILSRHRQDKNKLKELSQYIKEHSPTEENTIINGDSWEISPNTLAYERDIFWNLTHGITDKEVEHCQNAFKKELKAMFTLFFPNSDKKYQLNFSTLKSDEPITWAKAQEQSQIKILQDLSLVIHTLTYSLKDKDSVHLTISHSQEEKVPEKKIMKMFLGELLSYQNKIIGVCDIQMVDYFNSFKIKEQMKHYTGYYVNFLNREIVDYKDKYENTTEKLLKDIVYPVFILKENAENIKNNEAFPTYKRLVRRTNILEKQQDLEINQKKSILAIMSEGLFLLKKHILWLHSDIKAQKCKERFERHSLPCFMSTPKTDKNNRFFIECYLSSFVYFIDWFDKKTQEEIGNILNEELKSQELATLSNLNTVQNMYEFDYVVSALSTDNKYWNDTLKEKIKLAAQKLRLNTEVKSLAEKLNLEKVLEELSRSGLAASSISHTNDLVNQKEGGDLSAPLVIKKKSVNKI